MDIQKLKNYFVKYNTQISALSEKGSKPEIDLSGGLEEIMESIRILGYKWFQGATGYWNQTAQEAKQMFCREAVLYFVATGEVPTFNVQEVIGPPRSRTLKDVTWSFYDCAKKLEQMRANTPSEWAKQQETKRQEGIRRVEISREEARRCDSSVSQTTPYRTDNNCGGP